MPDKEKINIKLLAAILVALMSGYSTYMSTHASSKSDDAETKSDTKFEALMNQMNTLIIPPIQKELTENNHSLKELAKDVSRDRERLARVEGIIEGLPARLVRRALRTTPKPSKARSNLNKALSKHDEVVIPILEQFEQTNIVKGD